MSTITRAEHITDEVISLERAKRELSTVRWKLAVALSQLETSRSDITAQQAVAQEQADSIHDLEGALNEAQRDVQRLRRRCQRLEIAQHADRLRDHRPSLTFEPDDSSSLPQSSQSKEPMSYTAQRDPSTMTRQSSLGSSLVGSATSIAVERPSSKASKGPSMNPYQPEDVERRTSPTAELAYDRTQFEPKTDSSKPPRRQPPPPPPRRQPESIPTLQLRNGSSDSPTQPMMVVAVPSPHVRRSPIRSPPGPPSAASPLLVLDPSSQSDSVSIPYEASVSAHRGHTPRSPQVKVAYFGGQELGDGGGSLGSVRQSSPLASPYRAADDTVKPTPRPASSPLGQARKLVSASRKNDSVNSSAREPQASLQRYTPSAPSVQTPENSQTIDMTVKPVSSTASAAADVAAGARAQSSLEQTNLSGIPHSMAEQPTSTGRRSSGVHEDVTSRRGSGLEDQLNQASLHFNDLDLDSGTEDATDTMPHCAGGTSAEARSASTDRTAEGVVVWQGDGATSSDGLNLANWRSVRSSSAAAPTKPAMKLIPSSDLPDGGATANSNRHTTLRPRSARRPQGTRLNCWNPPVC